MESVSDHPYLTHEVWGLQSFTVDSQLEQVILCQEQVAKFKKSQNYSHDSIFPKYKSLELFIKNRKIWEISPASYTTYPPPHVNGDCCELGNSVKFFDPIPSTKRGN